MDISQAIEIANTLTIPGLSQDFDTLTSERIKNEEAIALLSHVWFEAERKEEPFSFDIVRTLADRNRSLCDSIGTARLQQTSGQSLARALRDEDLIRAVAKLQHRTVSKVRKTAGPTLANLDVAYVEAPVSGVVCGIDIETTDRYPDRGYIINVGFAFMELTANAQPQSGYSAYFCIPERYREEGVPLANIHHISYETLDGTPPFREAVSAQKAILKVLTSYPYLAHNASFEDSWFMLHLDGYAEARKAGRITVVDTRDICRRIDVDGRKLPREQYPNSLENWARRRKTLLPNEQERHLGLDDVDLMLRTVREEFKLRNMFKG